jgi:hypothetical protein
MMTAGRRAGAYAGKQGQRGGGAAGQASRLTLLVAIALACRGPRQNVGPEPVEAGGFSLILHSRHLLDVNIFVQHDGQADRVATVPASSSRAMVLPVWMLGQSRTIRIIAEPIGDATRYTTDMLVVQPGQIVELNVESSIDRSNYSIQ